VPIYDFGEIDGRLYVLQDLPIVMSVTIELDQPLVADPEVMRDLVEHDVSDLTSADSGHTDRRILVLTSANVG